MQKSTLFYLLASVAKKIVTNESHTTLRKLEMITPRPKY